jgi:hypothetical protein
MAERGTLDKNWGTRSSSRSGYFSCSDRKSSTALMMSLAFTRPKCLLNKNVLRMAMTVKQRARDLMPYFTTMARSPLRRQRKATKLVNMNTTQRKVPKLGSPMRKPSKK